jgi:hypothetical protein
MAEFGTPETWNMKVGNFIESELPKEKPQELLDLQEQNRKQRLLQSLQKIGPRLEDSSLDFINREEFNVGSKAASEYFRNRPIYKPTPVFEGNPGKLVGVKFKNKAQEKSYKDLLKQRYSVPKGSKQKVSNETFMKKFGISFDTMERVNRQLAKELNLKHPLQTYEGREKIMRARDKLRKENIKKTSSGAVESKIKRDIKKVDATALANDVDVAHRASLKANANLGAKYLVSSLGIDSKIVNQSLVKPTEQKLGKLYDDQQKLIKGLKPGKVPKDVQKKIEKLNIKISELSDRTKGALQGVLVDEKTLKPSIYGIDYKKVLGAGLIDKPVSELTQADRDIIKLNIDEQIKTAKKFKPGMQPDGRLVDLPGGNEKGFLGGEKLAKATGQKLLQALKVLGQPSVAAAFAADELRQGNIKTAGASLLAPELVGSFAPAGKGILSTIGRVAANPFGKAVRAFTPVGLATIGAGMGKDVYDEYKRREALTDEERLQEDIERDRLADEGMIGAAEGGRIGYADGTDLAIKESLEAFQRYLKAGGKLGYKDFISLGNEGVSKFFNSGGRVGFADGNNPKDPGRRTFMKLAAGLASLPVFGKFFKVAEKAAPVVQKLKNTTTNMPEWFPSLVDRFIFKGVGKKVDADVMEYTVKELPDVKLLKQDNGAIRVEGKNAYNEEYYIDYEPPGVELIDEVTGKSTKTKGDFVATDTEYRMISPEDYDIDGVTVDDIDEILGGSSNQLEGFAKGTGKTKYTTGQRRIDEADARGASKDESLRADINDPYEGVDGSDFTDD